VDPLADTLVRTSPASGFRHHDDRASIRATTPKAPRWRPSTPSGQEFVEYDSDNGAEVLEVARTDLRQVALE
jgi:hypothetical protein